MDYSVAAEKPNFLKDMIDTDYPGRSRAEIFKGDGWEIWEIF